MELRIISVIYGLEILAKERQKNLVLNIYSKSNWSNILTNLQIFFKHFENKFAFIIKYQVCSNLENSSTDIFEMLKMTSMKYWKKNNIPSS